MWSEIWLHMLVAAVYLFLPECLFSLSENVILFFLSNRSWQIYINNTIISPHLFSPNLKIESRWILNLQIERIDSAWCQHIIFAEIFPCKKKWILTNYSDSSRKSEAILWQNVDLRGKMNKQISLFYNKLVTENWISHRGRRTILNRSFCSMCNMVTL